MDSPKYAHGHAIGHALRNNDQAKLDFDTLTASEWVAKYAPMLTAFADETDFWGGVGIGMQIAVWSDSV